MGFDFLSQAAKFLQEQKNYKRWLAVFLCLAVTTVFGTAAALKMYGQAMTHQVRVLDCQYEVHEHTDDCYEKDENGDPTGDPVCGYADYVIHVHNDDCYDENGNLVCPLEEIELHEHDEDCYEETEVLVCEEGESESVSGHQHTDACYTEVQGELICEESTEGGHTHDDSCYSRELVCEKEEHTHDDSCSGRELTCSDESEEHEHDDSCYSEQTCDQEEHTHDDGCYDEKLTCEQEESAPHEHTDACYGTKKELTCTLGESESIDGHTHDDSCYETEEVLTCEELELHTHVEATVEDGGCYDESAFDEETGEFIEGSRPVCGIPQLEEHVHTEECFKTVELTPEEIAALEGGAKLHVHTEECYDEDGNLICTLLEKETEVHEHDIHCYDSEGNLVCGNEDAKDHEHDARCYDEEGNLTCKYEGVKDHEHDAKCYDEEGNLICGYEGVEDHVHTEDCYDEDGNLICGYEVAEETYDNSKTFACDDYVIIARYNEDAMIPEDAELLAEQITAADDEEHYARREAEYQEIMEDENAFMKALLKVGFYVDGEEEGEKVEVEPATPVTMTIQFLDEDGLAEGSPITVVHFAEEGSEKLDGGKAKDSSTTFRISSFSEIAVGYGPEETDSDINTDPVPVKVRVSKSYEYEDPMFHAVFQVDGDIMMPDGLLNPAEISGQPGDDSLEEGGASREEDASPEEGETLEDESQEEDATPEEGERLTEEEGSPEEGETSAEKNAFQKESIQPGKDTEIPEEDAQSEESGNEAGTGNEEAVTDAEATDQESEDGSVQDGETGENSTDNAVILTEEELAGTLEFVVEPLGEDSEEHKAAAVVYGDSDEEMFLNRVLSYYLTYEGVKLDLTDCSVTMEVAPTQALVDYAEELTAEESVDGDRIQDEVTLSIIDFVSDEETEEDTIEQTADDKMSADADVETDEPTADTSEPAADEPTTDTSITDEPTADTGTDSAYAGEADTTETQLTAEILDAVPVTNSAMSRPVRIALYATGTDNAVGAAATSQANPEFTVEFYAEIETLAVAGDKEANGKKSITVIDTSKSGLPKNGATMEKRNIYLNTDNTVVMKTRKEEIYSSASYDYISAPGLVYFNKIAKNNNYKLKEIWVLRSGQDKSDDNKWEKYSCADGKTWHFTNKSKTQEDDPSNFILITKDATIRLVHEVKSVEQKNGANFYDYDVSDGNLYTSTSKNTTVTVDRSKVKTHNSGDVWYMYTNRQGINSNSTTQTFGFGNAEGTMKTTMGEIEGNRANAKNAKYGSPTFGLVTGLKNGKLQYKSGVVAPNLFNEGAATGKTAYVGDLIFEQKGDTYTLTGAEVKEGGKVVSSKYGVNKFTRQRDNWDKSYYFAGNDFYPMDGVSSAGTAGHDLMFGAPDTTVLKNFSKKDTTSTLDAPKSDDGKNHNHYFGMHFTINFELVEDYVGPLEYLFYGDDDMWVFLNELDGEGKPKDSGRLVCDIGGVHSSVGEYVNLWDYITMGSKGKYQLTFFYTERGASGSTCWMQFTLPSVSFATTEQDTGKLQISKKVNGDTISESDEEFGFTVNFKDSAGKPLMNDYSYIKYNSNDVVVQNDVLIWNNAKVTLKAGERIVISFLPIGSKYEITEVGPVTVTNPDRGPGTDLEWDEAKDNPYTPETTGGKDTDPLGVVTGEVTKDTTVEVEYNNVRKFALPETGGPGTEVYAAAGALLILLGAGFVYKKKFRERRV